MGDRLLSWERIHTRKVGLVAGVRFSFLKAPGGPFRPSGLGRKALGHARGLGKELLDRAGDLGEKRLGGRDGDLVPKIYKACIKLYKSYTKVIQPQEKRHARCTSLDIPLHKDGISG